MQSTANCFLQKKFQYKISIKILSYDTTGTLTQTVSNNLKSNIATYLSKYRMINDYISIEVAKVIDLEFEFFVILDSSDSQSQVISEIINTTSNFMSPGIRELGQNVNISELNKQIQDIGGLNTLSEVKIYNKVGGQYSSNQTSQRYSNPTTKQIELVADTIFAEPSQIYQIRYPNKDISVRVLNFKNINFSW